MSNSTTNARERIGRYVTVMRRGRVYYAEIYCGGVQRRQSLRTRDLKEASARALDLDAQLRRGEMPERPARIVLADAVQQYLEGIRGEGRRPRTLSQYRYDLGAFVSFAARKGARCLDQVSLLFVEQHQAAQRKVGYADKTVQHQPEPLRSVIEVLAFTGMRIGELVWLTWDDVDFESGFIQIRPKDGWVPKHGRARSIPMHDRARAVLERLPRRHRWVFTARPSRQYPDGGHQISATHMLEKLKAVLRTLGIEGCLHTFRHFFISYCANSGVPPFQLMKWVGHADVTTVTIYYELRDAESLWAMRKLSALNREDSERTGQCVTG